MSAVVIDLNDALPLRPQPDRYDLDLIVQRLRETAETWVPRLFPNGRRVGDEWRLANIRGDAPRNTGSCVITLRGPHAGDWIDFDGNEGGGPISAIEAATGLDGRDLIVEAAQMAGVASGAPARQAPAAKPAPKRDASQDIAHILSKAVPIHGTPAAAYLQARGLTLPDAGDLLFHPDLTHWETKTGYPALLGQVRDRSGEVIGLHRTYIVEDGNEVRKAPVAKPKMMLGRVAGGAVQLAPLGNGDRLALTEGIETGLAAQVPEGLVGLLRELAGRGQDQAAHTASFALQEPLQNGQDEGGRLAGPGLGQAHHVLALETRGNGLLLYLGGLCKPAGCDSGVDSAVEFEFGK